jgi:hypothetical protein
VKNYNERKICEILNELAANDGCGTLHLDQREIKDE